MVEEFISKYSNSFMLDDDIVKKCMEGDRFAQERLYTMYAPRLYGICLRLASSKVEAEDILQEAFIKVFRRLGSYNGQGSLEGWIKRTVVNTAIDQYHLNNKKNNHLHLELVNEDQLESVAIPTDLDEQDLLAILEKIPPGYRLVFNLFAIEGYSHKEIGEMLSISEGTSKSQLAKARKYLQTLLYHYDNSAHGTRTVQH